MGKQRLFRFGVSGGASSRAEWVELARRAEDLGYSTLTLGDHISAASLLGGLGPVAAMMAAADATTTLRVGSTVLANDLRHPALLAQEAVTIDLLSDGRLELGLGSGWYRGDYEAVGVPLDPPATRIERLAEAVSLIKQLFRDGPVTFDGKHYHVRGLNLCPKPRQHPHPPLFIGGGGLRVLTLAAREADIVGLDPKGTRSGAKDISTVTSEAVAEKVTWVREAAGERYDALEIFIGPTLRLTGNRRAGAEEIIAAYSRWPSTVFTNTALTAEQILDSPHFLIGTVDQVVADLQANRERYGISYVGVGAGDMQAFSPVVAQLAGR